MYDWITAHPREFCILAFWVGFALIVWMAYSFKVSRALKRYRLAFQGECAWALALEEAIRKEKLGELYADYAPEPRPAHATERYRFLESYYDKIGRPRAFTGPSDFAQGPS